MRRVHKVNPDDLRASILQAAIQGKLVPQDPNDEPASVLLERIREEKKRLVKEGKLKKDKYVSFIFRRDNHYYENVDGEESVLTRKSHLRYQILGLGCAFRILGRLKEVPE